MENVSKVKKTNKFLLILGIITLVASLVFLGLFFSVLIPAMKKADLGIAFGLVLGIIFYLLPGFIVSILSIIFNILTYKSNPQSKYKMTLIMMVFSIIISIGYLISFALIYAI